MIDRLRSLVGAEYVRQAVATDAVHDAVPGAVVAPADADACAAVLAECSGQGWTVEIAGGRTSGRAGRPVDRIDVLLSTARLSGVDEYEPDDLTIGVAGGTPIGALRARVAGERQRLPLDPASERATVGGVLARAAAGPMRRSWSTPRRQLLGVRLVTGDGRVLNVGGRVVKNVAGYDLDKLITGSAGTLGVIARAHLRLLPVPARAATLVLAGVGPDVLLGAARALVQNPVAPAALELVGPPWRLIVLYEGESELVAAGSQQAEHAAKTAQVGFARDADRALEQLAVAEAGAVTLIRLADLPSRLPATLSIAQRLAGAGGTIAAHAGDGIVRVMPAADATRDVIGMGAAIEQARAEMKRGTVIIERGNEALLRSVDAWGPVPESTLRLARELKAAFDPAGILQRGRWLA